MIYGQNMTTNEIDQSELISAADATAALGFKHRSSLTRLVQRGDIAPAFKGSGATGEQFFRRGDVAELAEKRALAAGVA